MRLASRVFAPHYAAAITRRATVSAPIFAAPDTDPLSEILPGECFDVLELAGDRAWGVCATDGAVGYVRADALETSDLPCLTDADIAAPDVATAAEALIGTPERAGGRSPAGVDSAGLIFLSLRRAGIAAPRFLDLQAAQIGTAPADESPLARGDLLFFAGHAAVLVDGDNGVHIADGKVVRESLAAIRAAHGAIEERRRP